MALGLEAYSRFVAVLKVTLPLIALGLVLALFLIQQEDGPSARLVFSEADLEEMGSGLRISYPTFTGSSRANDLYRFTADLVVPDAAPPTRADITALEGEIAFVDGMRVELSSERAHFDVASELLTLAGSVSIETSDGYRIAAPRVVLDLAAGVLTADGEVVTDGPTGRIASETVRIGPAEGATGDERAVTFGGGVRLLYDAPPQEE